MLNCWKHVLALAGVGAMLVAAGCHKQAAQTSHETQEAKAAQMSEKPKAKFIQAVQNQPPDRLNETPLVVDGAMQMRDWGRTTSFYENGNTVAGAVGFKYESGWWQYEPIYTVEDSVLFVTQGVLLPVRLILAPPWEKHMYTGATIEPTYTAMPEVPPEGVGYTPTAKTSTAH